MQNSTGARRIARVLITTDKHVRDVDFKTIKGYKDALRANILDQIEYCENNEVTHVIDTGDIGDKGFRDLSQAYSWENLFKRWRKSCDYYSVIGNHLFLEMDSNPELFWIQPNQYIRPKDPNYIMPAEPLIKVVPQLIIGTVMFSFHHYSRKDKEYYCPRPPGITHHHAVYHDDVVIPSNIQNDYNLYRNISSEYLKRVFDNVDSCTVGHIHKDYGLVHMIVGGRQIPMDIPGSCCLTAVSQRDMHTEVKLPQYDIFDDGTLVKSYVTFSLHLDKMRLYKGTEKKVPKEIQEAANETRDFNIQERAGEILAKTSSQKLDPVTFLRSMGYTDTGLQLYQQAQDGVLTLTSAIDVVFNTKTQSEDLL